MKSRLLFVLLLGAILSILGTGCDTTSQGISGTQLRENFKHLKIGLTGPEVVALIGKPAAVNRLLTAAGSSEVWTYYDSQFRTAGQAAAVGALEGTGTAVKNNALRLTFAAGKVSAIETNQ